MFDRLSTLPVATAARTDVLPFTQGFAGANTGQTANVAVSSLFAALVASDVTVALGYAPLGPQSLGLPLGPASLDASGHLPVAQIPPGLIAGLSPQGGWNAATNTPPLASSVGTNGEFYVVTTGGTADLNGNASWSAGDWAVFGAGTWQRIPLPGGFGTMANQNAAAVAITGGAIGGVTISGGDASAANVTATPGTSPRTLATRAADRVNVLDYGAVPNGVTDCAHAFTIAMSQITGTWGILEVPRGDYNLGSVVNQPPGHSIRVVFDDGATTSGFGYLGVDCVESTQGAFRTRQVGGGFFGFQPSFGSSSNPGFVQEYITNTPQNSLSMRVGWDRRYTNSNIYGKAHSGIDIATQHIHSWPNMYDNSSGWALWEVVEGTTLDEDTAARAGLSTSVEISETDIVNNYAEGCWTWKSGIANTAQGMSIDPWGQNGNYGGSILFAYGSVGSFDGNSGGLNQRWFSYPAAFSTGNPPAVAAGSTIIVNGTTLTLTAGESLASIAAAINALNIANTRAAASVWNGTVTRLVIFSTAPNDSGTLALSGTALPLLGIAAQTYTTPRGSYAVAIGGAGSVAVGDQLTVNGTTVTVGGAGAASDVAAAINAANIAGIAADTNANGVLVLTCFMATQPSGLTLGEPGGYTTLAKLALNAGTFLPPTPPKAFATAYSDQTSPACLPTDQMSISGTDINGVVHGPVTVTLNGGDGSGSPAAVAASIQAALSSAGIYSSDFTALSTGSAVIAVRAVGSGTSQGLQIRNTAGGWLCCENVTGYPCDTLGVAADYYFPGGYPAASQTVFMAALDSIAPNGRGIFLGGSSVGWHASSWPHTPLEARGYFGHGLRLDRATYLDGNAVMIASGGSIAWGTLAEGQSQLTIGNGSASLDNIYSLAIGHNVSATGSGSVVLGVYASDWGAQGKFVYSGTASAEGQQMSCSTVQATSVSAPTRLTVNGQAPTTVNSIPVRANSVIGGTLRVVARNVNNGDSALWMFPLLARNSAGTIGVTSPHSGGVAPAAADASLTGAYITVTPDQTNLSVAITITPPSGVTLDASAVLDAVEG